MAGYDTVGPVGAIVGRMGNSSVEPSAGQARADGWGQRCRLIERSDIATL